MSKMISQNFKISSKYVSFAPPPFFLPCWGNMWFFHHFPNSYRTFARHLRFSKGCLSPSTSILGCFPSLELFWDGCIDEHALFASPPLNSWIASMHIFHLLLTLFNISPSSNEGDLEEIAIASQPRWEPHFCHLDAFPLHSHYSYYNLFIQYLASGQIPLYMLDPKV